LLSVVGCGDYCTRFVLVGDPPALAAGRLTKTQQEVDKSTDFVFIGRCLQVNLRHRQQKQKVSSNRHLLASFKRNYIKRIITAQKAVIVF
jgi:hypothetical protein